MRAGTGSRSGLMCQTVFSFPKLSMLVACLREVVAPGFQALAEFGNRWKPGAIVCQSKLAFVPQHASLV